MIFSYLLNMQSHPSWVCGLKLMMAQILNGMQGVTPFVGVWIETAHALETYLAIWRHTLRGCVD